MSEKETTKQSIDVTKRAKRVITEETGAFSPFMGNMAQYYASHGVYKPLETVTADMLHETLEEMNDRQHRRLDAWEERERARIEERYQNELDHLEQTVAEERDSIDDYCGAMQEMIGEVAVDPDTDAETETETATDDSSSTSHGPQRQQQVRDNLPVNIPQDAYESIKFIYNDPTVSLPISMRKLGNPAIQTQANHAGVSPEEFVKVYEHLEQDDV